MARTDRVDYLHERAMDAMFAERSALADLFLPLPEHECRHGSLPGDLLAACSCWATTTNAKGGGSR